MWKNNGIPKEKLLVLRRRKWDREIMASVLTKTEKKDNLSNKKSDLDHGRGRERVKAEKMPLN